MLQFELEAVRNACRSLSADYRPAITFITVQKRHHVRLFAEDSKDQVSGKGLVISNPRGSRNTLSLIPYFKADDTTCINYKFLPFLACFFDVLLLRVFKIKRQMKISESSYFLPNESQPLLWCLLRLLLAMPRCI